LLNAIDQTDLSQETLIQLTENLLDENVVRDFAELNAAAAVNTACPAVAVAHASADPVILTEEAQSNIDETTA